jgi:ribose 5-phosphate isomerase B
MKVYIAADHRGYNLKNRITKILTEHKGNIELIDLGPEELESEDDYPIFAEKVGQAVSEHDNSRGILICGSGIGMTIAANKQPGVRAALVKSIAEARQDRIEHDSNILVLDETLQSHTDHNLQEIVHTWLITDFGKGRHLRRVNEIRLSENLVDLDLTWPLIVHTILTPDFERASHLATSFKEFSPLINFDFIDNTLVQGETIDFKDILEIIAEADYLSSIHLMVKEPKPYLEKLNNNENVLLVYIHAEAEIEDILEQEWSFQLGITLNPETEMSTSNFAKFRVNDYHVIQLMTVHPGKQGGEFLPEVLLKVDKTRSLGYRGQIHLDGGIDEKTIVIAKKHKIDLYNVGSALLETDDKKATYMKLVEVACSK